MENKYKSNMLGQNFKNLRKLRHMTLSETAKDITSRSHLSRWENGEDQITIEILLRLLSRIQVSLEDLFKPNSSPLNMYLLKIAKLYANNDDDALRNLTQLFLEKYKKYPQNKVNLYKAAIADNYYKDLSNKDLFNDSKRMILWLRFDQISNWNQDDILIFGNVLYVLDSQNIYLATRSLLSFAIYNNVSSRRIINTCLNSVFALIKNKSYLKAVKLLHIIEKLYNSVTDSMDEMLLEKTRITYMKLLIQCIEDPLNSQKMIYFLNGLKAIGLNQRYFSYKSGWKQIKTIYQI